MKKYAFLALIFLLLSGREVLAIEEKDALFEYTCSNWAWVHSFSQAIIDGQGNVYSRRLRREGREEKTTEFEFVRKIDKATFDEMIHLIEPASKGPVSKEEQTAYDAGTCTLKCFLIDPVTGNRKEILLKEEGDFSCENMSREGQRLTSIALSQM